LGGAYWPFFFDVEVVVEGVREVAPEEEVREVEGVREVVAAS
jgi:hypothetical protein